MGNLREQLKTMTFKEKVDHIWEYYKIHIFLIVTALVLVISITSTILSKQEVILNISMMGEGVVTEDVQTVSESLNEGLSDSEVLVDHIPLTSDELDNQSYMYLQKLITKIATGSIDVLIVEESIYQDLLNEGAFTPIDEVVSLESNDVKEQHLYSQSGEIYGVSTTALPLFKGNDKLSGKVVCIPKTAKNKENINLVFE